MERQENDTALEYKAVGSREPLRPRNSENGAEEAMVAAGRAAQGRAALYEEVRAVGKGKFSVVFQGTVRGTHRPCALKKVCIFENMAEKSRRKASSLNARTTRWLFSCEKFIFIV